MSHDKSSFCICGHTGYVHRADDNRSCECCDCQEYRVPEAEGFKAENFKGVPTAVEKHGDGSVTLAKEVVQEILRETKVPEWVKVLFKGAES